MSTMKYRLQALGVALREAVKGIRNPVTQNL
jgi:hypothetical protein